MMMMISTLAKKNHNGVHYMQYDRLSEQQLSCLFEEVALTRRRTGAPGVKNEVGIDYTEYDRLS